MTEGPRRRPEVFRPDDPDLVVRPDRLALETTPAAGVEAPSGATEPGPGARLSTTASRRRGVRGGALLLSSLLGLVGLSLTLSMVRLVSDAASRQDWIGWTAFGLLVLAGVSLLAIVAREAVGLLRLRRLGQVRQELEAALARRDG